MRICEFRIFLRITIRPGAQKMRVQNLLPIGRKQWIYIITVVLGHFI